MMKQVMGGLIICLLFFIGYAEAQIMRDPIPDARNFVIADDAMPVEPARPGMRPFRDQRQLRNPNQVIQQQEGDIAFRAEPARPRNGAVIANQNRIRLQVAPREGIAFQREPIAPVGEIKRKENKENAGVPIQEAGGISPFEQGQARYHINERAAVKAGELSPEELKIFINDGNDAAKRNQGEEQDVNLLGLQPIAPQVKQDFRQQLIALPPEEQQPVVREADGVLPEEGMFDIKQAAEMVKPEPVQHEIKDFQDIMLQEVLEVPGGVEFVPEFEVPVIQPVVELPQEQVLEYKPEPIPVKIEEQKVLQQGREPRQDLKDFVELPQPIDPAVR